LMDNDDDDNDNDREWHPITLINSNEGIATWGS
jgi:hypothetical protein